MTVADDPDLARFARLQELTSEAASVLRLPVEHSRVSTLASLRLLHEQMLETMCAGERVDPSRLMAISKTIAELSMPSKDEDQRQPDLSLLSDRELALAEYFTRKALGEAPQKPAPRYSRRHWMAVDVVKLLDQIEREKRPASEAE